MFVADKPFCKNLARLLGYKEHYERNEEFQDNLKLIKAKTGLSKENIYKWCGGGGFTYDSLVKVCELFGWDLYDLFYDHEKCVRFHDFDKERMEIMRKLATVNNKDLLAAIMASIRMGLAVNGKDKF